MTYWKNKCVVKGTEKDVLVCVVQGIYKQCIDTFVLEDLFKLEVIQS